MIIIHNHDPILAYHFFRDTLRDGTPVPADGEALEVPDPERLELCRYGLHASRCPLDALHYAPGPNLARVALSGAIEEGCDKLCAQRRVIIQRIDATELLRQFARECALNVIHLWDAPDVVREYLETGDEAARGAMTSRGARGAMTIADNARGAAMSAATNARTAAAAWAKDAMVPRAAMAAADAMAAEAWAAAEAAEDALASLAAHQTAMAAAEQNQAERLQALVDKAFSNAKEDEQ